MKNLKRNLITFQIILIGIFAVISLHIQSCDPDKDNNDIDTTNVVYKPNIYLYPVEKTKLKIKVSFPTGGEILTSIPEYGTGWDIVVNPDGLIDGKYNYLFYESKQADVWQLSKGWIVKREELEDFFIKNLADFGFNGREIKDFTDYWIPRLKAYEMYEIYPQEANIINGVIRLEFSEVPDHLLRLFYVIKGTGNVAASKLSEPIFDQSFKREGFYVTEWGVILK